MTSTRPITRAIPEQASPISITVTSASSSTTTTPTGTLTIVVDGTTETSSLALSNGSATYNFSSTTLGSHVITATYSGDSNYASSSGTLTVTVTARTFTLAATNVTVSAGSSGTSTITITPKNGYTGTIGWSISSSPPLKNGCFSLPNTTASGTSAVQATMTVYTSASACSSGSLTGPSDGGREFVSRAPSLYRNDSHPL